MIHKAPFLPSGVVLRPSARARRIALKLDVTAGHVVLIVPQRTPLDVAQDFAWARRDWVEGVLSALPTPVPFVNGAILPLWGKNIRVEVESGHKGSRVALDQNRGVLCVRLAVGAHDSAPIIERFLWGYARTMFLPLLLAKADRLGLPSPHMTVREMKTRWGSCCQENGGRISLSWRLIFAPLATSDYVVAHEVAHLLHGNHSPAFWALCKSLSVSYAVGKAWIHKEGITLTRFGTGEKAL